MKKTYSEMIKLKTFKERFDYLKLNGVVSELTFGSHRYLNQDFYHSDEWRNFRYKIIVRDDGCDLAMPDRVILDKIIIHHINPISVSDIVEAKKEIMDPENVICVSTKTHNAMHYGNYIPEIEEFAERKPNDTCPWR